MSAIPALDTSAILSQRSALRSAPAPAGARTPGRGTDSSSQSAVQLSIGAGETIDTIDGYGLRTHPSAPTDDPLGRLPDKSDENAEAAREKKEPPKPKHVLQVALLSMVNKSRLPYSLEEPAPPTLDVLA
jgi:hypothetical protein